MSQSSYNDDIPVLTALNDDQVADYLQRNPDFLMDKPGLLAALELPHRDRGEAVSLIERQVSVLRERNMDMRHRLSQLLDNARTNDMLFDKTKRLVLSLADTTQFDDCLDALFFGLQTEFDIEYSSLLLIHHNADMPVPANRQARLIHPAEIAERQLSFLQPSFQKSRATCGQLEEDEKTFIFTNKASEIGSTAVASLYRDNQLLGILAIANRDPEYYRSSMNILFLNFIADMLARLLHPHLSL